MKFSEVVGQGLIKEKLLRTVRSGRIPHAQIFLGPKGCGKLALALATAQYLLCENPLESDSCGECSQCVKASKLIHPDLHFSYPVVGAKAVATTFINEWREAFLSNPYMEANDWFVTIGAENKQGNITKDECMEIIKKFSFKVFEGKYKILVLWLPEYLAKEGNRLLKLIEEPQPNTIFILVAENADLILNTITSRCQLVRIPSIDESDLINYLQEHEGLDKAQATSVCFLADGNYNSARNIIQDKKDDHPEFMIDWMRKCFGGSPADMISWVDQFARMGRENQKHFLDFGIQYLRELLILKVSPDLKIRLQGKALGSAKKLADLLDPESIEDLIETLNDCHYYIERNANPKVLMLDTSIKLKNIFRKIKERSLVTN